MAAEVGGCGGGGEGGEVSLMSAGGGGGVEAQQRGLRDAWLVTITLPPPFPLLLLLLLRGDAVPARRASNSSAMIDSCWLRCPPLPRHDGFPYLAARADRLSPCRSV